MNSRSKYKTKQREILLSYFETVPGVHVTAIIIGLMMLVLVLFSSFYIAAEADHDCCGEDCPICVCIHQCENILRGIGDGTVVQSAAVAPVILILFAAAFVIAAVSRDTLVSRKVRLNN